jgi:hypothetical protein
MKITVKISGENAALVDTLKAKGVSAKLVRGGIIVELPAAKDQKRSRGDPEAIEDHRNAPVNSLGYLRVMFTVNNIEDTLPRLQKKGRKTCW